MILRDRFGKAMHFHLSTYRQLTELLEMLFPDGLDQPPRLSIPAAQSFTLNALALAYHNSGQPGRAVTLFRFSNDIDEKRGDQEGIGSGLGNLSDALHKSGALCEAEAAARRALDINRDQKDHFLEAVNLIWLGLTLAARGSGVSIGAQYVALQPMQNPADIALRRSIRVFRATNDYEGIAVGYLVQATLWRGDLTAAKSLADHAWQLAHLARYERNFIRVARLQGEAALGLGDFETADERLHHALTRSRAVNYVEEELPALVALAELARRKGDPAAARDLLDDIWDAAERGPYRCSTPTH
jgi:tetratricopeptide (TPR) repeat protein